MWVVAPVTPRQFAWFRLVFGLYLAIHFLHLVPWGAELFSREGVLPTATLNPTHGVLPNILVIWDTPGFVTAYLIGLAALSLLLAAGVGRRLVAVVLWYGWACLFNRNVLISNPSIPYVGLLLLLTALVPPGESLKNTAGRARGSFYVPGAVYWTAWFVMAAGYTFSGLVKLSSPSWVDGTALWHVLQNPLARDGWYRDLAVALPLSAFRVTTWYALSLEILFLPLAIVGRTRAFVWAAMAGMHLGILGLVAFADLSAGMLMVHMFTFDRRWLDMLRGSRLRPATAPVVFAASAPQSAPRSIPSRPGS